MRIFGSWIRRKLMFIYNLTLSAGATYKYCANSPVLEPDTTVLHTAPPEAMSVFAVLRVITGDRFCRGEIEGFKCGG